MTAILNERQQVARRLATELESLEGVWVRNPMPLPDHSKLQVQVLDTIRNRVIQMIKDAGYEPICRGVLPRIHATGWLAASIYEVDFPKPQIPVQDDRIRGEIATREKPSWEIEQLRRYLGIGPKK